MFDYEYYSIKEKYCNNIIKHHHQHTNYIPSVAGWRFLRMIIIINNYLVWLAWLDSKNSPSLDNNNCNNVIAVMIIIIIQ